MIGYATPSHDQQRIMRDLLAAVNRAEHDNRQLPRDMARAEISDYLGHLAEDITDYLAKDE
jgi:hypothetical protein